MSGYLRRMLAAAGARKPSLRPFAGSIYENGPQSWTARRISGGDADADNPERHLAVEANDDGGEADDRRHASLASQRAAHDAQNPAAPVPVYASLHPQRHDRRFAPAPSPSLRSSNPVDQELTLPQAVPAERAGEAARGSDQLGRRAAGDPRNGAPAPRLLAPTVTRAPGAAGRAPAIESTISSPAGRDGASSSVAPRTADYPPPEVGRTVTTPPLPAHAAPQRHSESGAREFFRSAGAQDQNVEIRIGRIEVLAAAPPATRAPAASQSRTTSLADYLARRSGHSR
jgi:hypothetical protein